MAGDKNTLRRELRARLRTMTPEIRAAASERLCARLSALLPAPAGRLVAGYLPLPTEPDLGRFYRHVLAGGGRLAVPLLTGPTHMTFRLLPAGAMDDGGTAGDTAANPILRPGPHGLREPDPAQCPVAAPEEIDLVLVPGLGFTPGGVRLGRGAGYYDRWLAEAPAGLLTVGVAFECQLTPDLPSEPHDWQMDYIVTENGWTAGASAHVEPPA
jgi:5-formyltetrahydrofolate cyclo-ligase